MIHVLHIPFDEQLIKEPFVNTFKANIDSECAVSLTDELKELSQIVIFPSKDELDKKPLFKTAKSNIF